MNRTVIPSPVTRIPLDELLWLNGITLDDLECIGEGFVRCPLPPHLTPPPGQPTADQLPFEATEAPTVGTERIMDCGDDDLNPKGTT